MDDWKKARLNAEACESGKKIIEDAINRKKANEDEDWDSVSESLYQDNQLTNDVIKMVVGLFRNNGYELPVKKIK